MTNIRNKLFLMTMLLLLSLRGCDARENNPSQQTRRIQPKSAIVQTLEPVLPTTQVVKTDTIHLKNTTVWLVEVSVDLVDSLMMSFQLDSLPVQDFLARPIKFRMPLHIRITNIDKFKIRSFWSHDSIEWRPLYWRSMPDSIQDITFIMQYKSTSNPLYGKTRVHLMIWSNIIQTRLYPIFAKSPDVLLVKKEFIDDFFFVEPVSLNLGIDPIVQLYMYESAKLSAIFPPFARRIRAFITEARVSGYNITIASQGGLRSLSQQEGLYAIGRKKLRNGRWVVVNRKRVVTMLMSSNHNYGLACDIIFFKQENESVSKYYPSTSLRVWKEVAAIAKKHGLKWGGDWRGFKDFPHMELTYKNFINKYTTSKDSDWRNTLRFHLKKAGYFMEFGVYWFMLNELQNSSIYN